MNCPHCKKELNPKGFSHIKLCKDNPDRKLTYNVSSDLKGRTPWNKGLTKDTDDRVLKYSKECGRSGDKNSFFGKHHSEESLSKISLKLSINNKGGRCKWYKAINNSGVTYNVQGTWELEFIKYLNIIDDDWVKIGIGNSCHTYTWYDDNNIPHKYTPDFWSPKLKKYYEVKGYWWGNDKRKMELVLEQNNINLSIITKKELTAFLKLV